MLDRCRLEIYSQEGQDSIVNLSTVVVSDEDHDIVDVGLVKEIIALVFVLRRLRQEYNGDI